MNLFHEFFGDPLKQAKPSRSISAGARKGDGRIHRSVATFERFLLTPLSFAVPILAISYLCQRAWLVGAFLLFVWFCIAAIGQSLHKDKRFAELAAGGLTTEKNIKPDSEMSWEEAHRFARPLVYTSRLLGVTTGVLLFHHGCRWFVAVPIAVFVVIVTPMILTILFARPASAAKEEKQVPSAKAGRWDAVLSKCDLVMSRDEIAVVHRQLNEEAKRKYGEYFWKNEYATPWNAFRDNPNIETARAFLDVAPDALPFFEACSPGSGLYSTNRHISERGLLRARRFF